MSEQNNNTMVPFDNDENGAPKRPNNPAPFEPGPPPDGFIKPSLTDVIADEKKLRIIVTAVLLVLAAVSFFVLRPHFESPNAWTAQVETLDAKKGNVLGLTTATVGLSAVISAIPGEAGVPIADQLMDVSGNLGIVLGMLYLEKYMLTIFSFVSFGLLIPVGCALLAIGLWIRGILSTGALFGKLAARLFVLSLVLLLAVPASVWVTNMVDETYETSLITSVDTSSVQSSTAQSGETINTEDGDVFTWLSDLANSVTETVTSGLTSISDAVVGKINAIIEGAAVMIVTSCVIPILVLLLFLWIGHLFLGLDISAPMSAISNRATKMMPKKAAAKK